MTWTRWVAVAALLSTVGCYRTPVVNVSPSGSPGAVVVKPAHTLIYGMVPLTEVDAAEACGANGIWSVDTRYNAISWLAQGLTFGIYTPMYARITCNGG